MATINRELTLQPIELNLSVQWGNINMGYNQLKPIGNYYAWGETTTKTEFTWDNYKYKDHTTGDTKGNITKYYVDGYLPSTPDNITTLVPDDDVAYQVTKLSTQKWRMPTKKEFDELVRQCTMITEFDKSIYKDTVAKFKGKNGNTITLPAGGFKTQQYTSLIDGATIGKSCNYWTSSLNQNNGELAYSFNLPIGNATIETGRYVGYNIRPVLDKNRIILTPKATLTFQNLPENTKLRIVFDKQTNPLNSNYYIEGIYSYNYMKQKPQLKNLITQNIFFQESIDSEFIDGSISENNIVFTLNTVDFTQTPAKTIIKGNIKCWIYNTTNKEYIQYDDFKINYSTPIKV